MNSTIAPSMQEGNTLRTRRILARGQSRVGPCLVPAYRARVLRPAIRWWLRRFEGGMMCSLTWREILRKYEGVTLGAYSRGAGIRPGLFMPGTVIGRFSCFAVGLDVLRRNHPANRLSQHPLFFDSRLGLVNADTRNDTDKNPLTIGSDVWTGIRVILCPGCGSIGDGAIIGAGSVVTKDVPPFSIVAGNPARVLRPRFSPEVEAVVAASRWWNRPIEELLAHQDLFSRELTEETLDRFRHVFPPWTDGTEAA